MPDQNGFAFKSEKYSDVGVRVVRISDVQKRGKMSDKNLVFYPTDEFDALTNYELHADDLVMSLTGNTGRVAMLSESDLPAALNQRVCCLRPISETVLVRYLFHLLGQDCFENIAMANSTGGGQKNLSTTWLSNLRYPNSTIVGTTADC